MKALSAIFGGIITLTSTGYALAAPCTFRYWEVIPANTNCQIFHLPDFQFRSIPQDEDVSEHIRRFCKQYEVRSSLGTQKAGYCYTGEGDRIGPRFQLGKDAANKVPSESNAIYTADLNFKGCVDGAEAEGLMFLPGDWRKAPPNVKRFRPVEKPGDKSCN